jgi:dUTPase
MKQSRGAAGIDIHTPEDIYLPDGAQAKVDTGLTVRVKSPAMYPLFSLLVPRSSCAKNGLKISNTVGIIDPDYSGQGDTIQVYLERQLPAVFHLHRETVNINSLPKAKGNVRVKSDTQLTVRQEGSARNRAVNMMRNRVRAGEASVNGEYTSTVIRRDEDDTDLIHVEFLGAWVDHKGHNADPLVYKKGERFAQMLFIPFSNVSVTKILFEQLAEEGRGGFGSTGTE